MIWHAYDRICKFFLDLFAAIDFIKEKFLMKSNILSKNPTTSHLLSVFGDDGFIEVFKRIGYMILTPDGHIILILYISSQKLI